MKIFTWAVRLVVFVLLAAFAAKNADLVTLRFYFDLALQAPLVLVLFGFFAAGALFGMLALIGTLMRQRREIARLKKQADAPAPPPVAGL
ncbi:MAG: lipopolysaccharide assembly protein [Betaproteobacteria bacterium]|nr:lipopolysaccharide assembly protein [Betaproteobacteria bacterium]